MSGNKQQLIIKIIWQCKASYIISCDSTPTLRPQSTLRIHFVPDIRRQLVRENMAGILSITGSVLGIISAIAKLTTQVHETMQEYKMASSTLAAINNECAVLSATMNTLGRLSRKHRAKITNQSLGLTQPFNASLLACETTLVALTREIQRLGFIGKTKHEWIPLVRMKYIWNEKTIKDLLEQLRWQGQTLNLLINTIQLWV